MNPKSRITYRFDQKNGSRIEPKSVEAEHSNKSNIVSFFQEEMKFTTEVGSWNSPFQHDAHALEQLIRDTDRGPNRQSQPSSLSKSRPLVREEPKEPTPTQTDAWTESILLGDEYTSSNRLAQLHAYPIIDLDETDSDETEFHDIQTPSRRLTSFKKAANYRPSRGPSWFKVFASVTAAIATGAIFGYFVLLLFNNNPNGQQSTASDSPAPIIKHEDTPAMADVTNNVEAAPSGTNKPAENSGKSANTSVAGNDTKNDSASIINVEVPETAYYLLQYGVFSNKDGLDATINELNNKGLAAAFFATPEDYRVYVGMSTKKSEAQALAKTLAGMDLYVKQVDVPALNQLAFSGNKKIVENFFNQTAELISQLDAMTITRLNTGSTASANWTELHQQWTKTAGQMESGMINKDDKSALLKLEQIINTAVVTASEYAKKPSNTYLWTMQTALMQAIFIQKTWFMSTDGL